MVVSVFEPVLQSYSPRNVLVVAGLFLMTQWNKVTVKYDAPIWDFTVGCYGKTVRRKVNNPLGTITLELPQKAAGNVYNSLQLGVFDELLKINGIMPIAITDLWGGSIHIMINACIAQYPDVSYDASPQDRSWVFRGEMDINIISK